MRIYVANDFLLTGHVAEALSAAAETSRLISIWAYIQALNYGKI